MRGINKGNVGSKFTRTNQREGNEKGAFSGRETPLRENGPYHPRPVSLPESAPLISLAVPSSDGTVSKFRNVGTKRSDAKRLPKKQNTNFVQFDLTHIIIASNAY